jgi:TonB-linked SusC/RagA family outer membrane protein
MKRFILFLASLLVVAGVASAQAPSTVRGKVTFDEDGSPLPGVSVFVKGASVGTVTNLEGDYVLNGVPSNATTLVISCIGMRTQEVPIKAVVNVVMTADSEALEEAVVTIAYGAAKKSTLTGAIASVNAEQITNRPTSSVTSALEGTVSGVQINNTIGSPGNDPHVYIRGVGTINGSSSVLYVLDGVAFGGNISDLNPADIESITVLKDAASAALYGNRASNGVILITTKKGTQGRLNLNLDMKQGVYQRGIPEYKLANAKQWMEIYWQAVKNEQIENGKSENEAAAYTSANIIPDKVWINVFNKPYDKLFNEDGTMVEDAQISSNFADDLDWYKFGLRNGYRAEYNLSGSGATEKSDYYFSAGYLKEDGYVTNSGFERFSARAAANIRPVKWLKLGLNLNATHQNYSNTNGNEGGASSYTNLFMYARNIAPVYPAHLHYNDLEADNYGQYILDGNGAKQWDGGSYIDENGGVVQTRNQYPDRHVLWENELNRDVTTRNTLNATGTAEIYFLKDFTFTVTGNMATRTNIEKTYNSAVIGDGKSNNGRGGRYEYNYKNWQLQEQLRWTRQFGDHNLNVLVGHENYYWDREYLYAYKTAEVLPGKNNLKNFTEITEVYSYDDHYRTESFLSRVRYAYKDRYNVEASFRRDGSSRFAANKRWGNFWSIGANWMISNENFMKNVTWVNSLKLRADYGEVGNDASASYYADRLLYSSGKNANRGAFWLSQLESPDIKWETSASWGVGIEARLFNRWNLNMEYFDKQNRDLIFNVYNPLSAGATDSGSAVSTVAKNLGTISNHGVEIETDFDIVRTRDFRLNVMANASFIRNKVVKLPEENREDGIISGTHKIMEGHDRYEYYLYVYEGVDMLSGRSLYKFDDKRFYITDDNTANGNILYGTAKNDKGVANTLMSAENYVIVNGVPYVYKPSSYGAREFTGTSSLPKAFGSFGLNLTWKNFSFSSLFTYGLGGQVYDDVYAGMMSLSGSPSSQHEDLMGSWKEAPVGMTVDSPARINKDALPQINTKNSSDNNAGTTTRWLVSGNYLVLKNVSISYQLPKKWLNPIHIQGASISANIENLKTWSARQGMNPQQSRGGVQSNYLVTPRVMTLAVNVRF